MPGRKIASILAISLGLMGVVYAIESHHITKADGWGNIQSFWLTTSTKESVELKYKKSELAKPKTLHRFTQEATSYDIIAENTKFYLVFESDLNIFLIYSRDDGQTFSSPVLISEAGRNPSLAIRDNLLALTWEENGVIYLIENKDGEKYFGQPKALPITGEALSCPKLLVDKLNNIHLSFLSTNNDNGLNKIVYSKLLRDPISNELVSPETKVLFETHDDLINPRIKRLNNDGILLIFWQKEYLDRRQAYLAVSLDNGKTFSREKTFEFGKDLLDIGFINGKLYAITYEDKQVIELPPLSAPQILSPENNTVLNSSDLKLAYTHPASDPLFGKIELSQDSNFSTTLDTFPSDLADGTYFVRVSAFDGISASLPSQTISFRVDNTPPEIISLEAERTENNMNFKGKISESPAWLSINQIPCSLESFATFEVQLPLEAGENIFTFSLSDEAGNLFIATEEVFYNPASPEITVSMPAESDWFKPESTIIVKARVFDLQGDIEDESEAQVMIDNTLLESALAYDREESNLFGFISLPQNLADGKHTGKIIFSDNAGNQGEGQFVFNIDGSPPRLEGGKCFTNSRGAIPIPLVDQGAGIDMSGTLIKIKGISFEGTASVEAGQFVVACDSLLLEGTYEVLVEARDLVGNIGDAASFSLIVDTTPPKITLSGTYEARTNKNKLLIEGKVDEKYPSSIKIKNNNTEVKNFTLNGNYFSAEINLAAGSNNILIEATDLAANTASENIRTFAADQTSSGLISSFVQGPNPFSPVKDLPGAFSAHGKGMIFSYALTQPSDINIRIYDITGTLIWVKDIKNTPSGSGVTAWSGVDQFGNMSSNGIYPYFFSVSASGARETRRGKIVIVK